MEKQKEEKGKPVSASREPKITWFQKMALDVANETSKMARDKLHELIELQNFPIKKAKEELNNYNKACEQALYVPVKSNSKNEEDKITGIKLNENKRNEFLRRDEQQHGKGLPQDTQRENVAIKKDEIYWDKKSASGCAYGEKFNFAFQSDEHKVFCEMYKNMNQFIPREKVLELMGCDDDKKDNYLIYKLVKTLRKKTGLSKDRIKMSRGALMLVASKV